MNAWPGYEFLYLAEVKGFYEEEGVEVRIVQYDALEDASRAYKRGGLDGLGCTLIELLKIRDDSDRKPKVALVADYSDGADVVMARSGTSQLSDLKGARIGLEMESLGLFVLGRLLDEAGLEFSDIEAIPMDQDTIESKFCSGDIDAAITYAPHTFQIENQCKGRAVFSSADIPKEIVDVLIFEESVLKNRKEDVAKVLRAFYRAVDYSRENPEDAYAIMARREGLTAAEFEEALTSGIKLVGPEEQQPFFQEGGELYQAISHCRDIMLEMKQVKTRVSPSDCIDDSVLDNVIARTLADSSNDTFARN